MDGVANAEPIRLGVLSTARINRSLLRAAALLPDLITVTHVASRNPSRAAAYAARYGIGSHCRSYDELLDSPIDAVYVPLPAALHGTWSIRALQAGKHVLCEKPFAANETEAIAMVDMARSAELIIMEAMHYRYHPLVELLYQLAWKDRGSIRSVEARFQWPVPDLSDIRGQYDLGGGATMDMGCYAVHWLRSTVGEEPRVLSARAVGADHDPRVDVRLDAELSFPGGASGHYVASMEAAVTPAFILHVEMRQGTLTADPFINPEHITVTDGAGTRELRLPGAQTGFWYQLGAFYQSVRQGVQPLTSGPDSVANMRVIDALYRAAALPVRRPFAVETGG
jgi:predicted dehydrogenase